MESKPSTNILGVLLAIFLFPCLCLIFILSSVTSLMSADFYGDLLKDVDFTTIKVADIDSSLELEYGSDATIEDVLVDELKEYGVEEDTVREVINDDEIKEIVGGIFGEMVEYYATGNGEIPQVEKSDVTKILDKLELSEAQKQEVYNFIDELNQSIAEGMVE